MTSVAAPVDLLLVEDNPGDVDLCQEALRQWGVPNRLHVVHDGVEAMDYLHKTGKYSDATVPDLILLDLNLPKKDGREVLSEIKSDDHLKTIPVTILSTSDADSDVQMTYSLGANCYVPKGIGIDNFTQAIQSIGNFWFSTVKLPPKEVIIAPSVTSQSVEPQPKVPLNTVLRLSLRVLVVDDNEADSNYIKEILSALKAPSFNVTTCTNLRSAMILLEREAIDVVLLDLNLPDSHGLSSYTSLAYQFPSVPFIITTGLDDDKLALNAIRIGAGDYIVKGTFDAEALARDIKYAIERKESEADAELQRHDRGFAEADALKQKFLANMSHELKTPLNAIIGFSELLFEDYEQASLAAEYKEYLGHIVSSGRHLLALINDILELAQIESGDLQQHLEPAQIANWVNEVVAQMRDAAAAKEIVIKVHVEPNVSDGAMLDKRRFRQVIHTYVSNAILVSPPRSIVNVSACRKDGAITLSVEDGGPSLCAVDAATAFKSFQLLGDPLTRKHGGVGLGLGLALTKQIVEKQGGVVGVKYRENQTGNDFYAMFPINPSAAAKIQTLQTKPGGRKAP
jgi:signal transduction histidine kinase